MSTTKHPTHQDLRTALSEADDFGHEMRVCAGLRNRGWQVQHGWTYVDPVETKPRQFDIRATLEITEKRAIYLAAECKNLAPESPLIVSGSVRTQKESFHELGRCVVYEQTGYRAQQVCRTSGFYRADTFVGRSVVRMRQDKAGTWCAAPSLESEVYNRWTQALASAHELCNSASARSGNSAGRYHTAVLPVLVFPDGCLWEAEYRDDGALARIEQTSHTTIFVNHVVNQDGRQFRLTHIHMFSIGGFAAWLTNLNTSSDDWNRLFLAAEHL